MKVTIPLGLVVLAVLIGYLLGTEAGRARRDVVLVKLGRRDADMGAADDGSGTDATA